MRLGRFSGALPLVLMTVLIVAVGVYATVRQDAFLTSYNLNNLLLLAMPPWVEQTLDAGASDGEAAKSPSSYTKVFLQMTANRSSSSARASIFTCAQGRAALIERDSGAAVPVRLANRT